MEEQKMQCSDHGNYMLVGSLLFYPIGAEGVLPHRLGLENFVILKYKYIYLK